MEKEKKVTIAERVLRFIGEAREGRRAKEIHVFAFKCSNPDLPETHRSAKSWWGTNLYYGSMGLLENFCMKTEDGRWVLTEKPEGPFFSLKRPKTETYKLNRAKRERERKLRDATAVKCPHCGSPNRYHESSWATPDGQAHFTGGGYGYSNDCKDRVWAGYYYRKEQLNLTTLNKPTLEQFSDILRRQSISWGVQHALVEAFVNNSVRK